MKGFKKRLRLLFPPNRVSKLRPAKIFNFYFFIAASREGQNRKRFSTLSVLRTHMPLYPLIMIYRISNLKQKPVFLQLARCKSFCSESIVFIAKVFQTSLEYHDIKHTVQNFVRKGWRKSMKTAQGNHCLLLFCSYVNQRDSNSTRLFSCFASRWKVRWCRWSYCMHLLYR